MELVRKYPVIIIFAAYVVIEITKVTGVVCGPVFQRIFGFSDTRLGLFFSALAMGGILTNLCVGHFIHRLGLWRAWSMGLLGTIFAVVAVIVIAGGFWGIFIPIFLLGIAHIFTINVNHTFLSHVYNDKLQRVMGLASGLWFGSSVLTAPVVGYWVEWSSQQGMHWSSYGVPYLINIGLMVIIFTVGFQLLRPLLKSTDSDDRAVTRRILADTPNSTPSLGGKVLICLIAYLHGTAIVALMTWANPMVQAKFEVSDFHGSLVLMALALGLATGRLFIATGLLALDNRKMLFVCGLTGGLLFAVSINLQAYWLTLAAIATGGLLMSGTAPAILALVSEKFFVIKAHVFGHIGVSISLASFITPWMIGIMADTGMPLDKVLWLSPLAAGGLGLISIGWKIADKQAKVCMAGN